MLYLKKIIYIIYINHKNFIIIIILSYIKILLLIIIINIIIKYSCNNINNIIIKNIPSGKQDKILHATLECVEVCLIGYNIPQARTLLYDAKNILNKVI